MRVVKILGILSEKPLGISQITYKAYTSMVYRQFHIVMTFVEQIHNYAIWKFQTKKYMISYIVFY